MGNQQLAANRVQSFWTPQPGPQAFAVVCPATVQFFGGNRGGGKSEALIGRQVQGAMKHGHAWNGLVLRRKFKDFAEIRRRFDELIRNGLPAERTGGDQQTNYVRFENGAKITLAAIMRLDMADSYQGFQFTEVSIDEAPNIPFIAGLVEKMKGCLRSPHGVPCHMFLTGNPGGPGSAAIKAMFIEKGNGNVFYDSSGTSHVFIESKLADNKILCDNDPLYVNRLMSIKDKALREAWLEGNWDVAIGAAFDFVHERHVIDPIPIPEYAPLMTAFDWGFGAPFSWQWFWVDSEGRIYLFHEWYGWDGITPNKGLRISDSEIAQGIIEREQKLGIWGRDIRRLAGPDCFQKKPNYMGGGQGPSTAEVFAQHGLILSPGDPSRALKMRQVRERLRLVEGERPMLQVYSSCKQFLRTFPALCLSEINPEELEDGQEEHCFDSLAHVCMARPLHLEVPAPKQTFAERDFLKVQGREDEIQDPYDESDADFY